MCGRFGVTFKKGDLVEEFDLFENPKFDTQFRYNVAPSQDIISVAKNSPLRAYQMKWGFIPEWTKPPDAKFKPINARAEKITGGFYKKAFEETRCLIPVSFFYEWKATTKDGKEYKQPYLIKHKKRDVFALAGIYSKHTDAGGKDHYFTAIITTTPNSLMKKIHNRMPVIIDHKDYDRYIDGEFNEAKKLLKPYMASLMESYRVSDMVSSSRNEGEELTRKVV